MTDRTDGRRGGRGKGPAKRSSDRTDEKRGARSEGSREDQRSRKDPRSGDRKGGPTSKRAGRRPPKALRDSSRTEGGSWRDKDQAAGMRSSTGSGRAKPTTRTAGPPKKRADRGDRPERPGQWDRKKRYEPTRSGRRRDQASKEGKDDGLVRLNRYLAQAGICSRREADDLITAGVVSVNGQIVTELGTKVKPTDTVHYGGQRLSMEKKRYVLLNKPKGFITTTDDPRDRRTVMALVEAACQERLYPVGRLDRLTTGVLLMTNDGDLAKKLTHPSHGAEKIYHVTLGRSVTKAELAKLLEGVMLEDGMAQADEANHVEGASKREVGVKLHMGRNRIVRRMFEALGHEVVKLDRVVFAGLTKKDVPRGKWRHLSENEVLFLSKRK